MRNSHMACPDDERTKEIENFLEQYAVSKK